MTIPEQDYYAVENTVRLGVYPGRVISTHESHWAAVAEMIRLKPLPSLVPTNGEKA